MKALGRFTIVRELGRGGQGVVFEAETRSAGRTRRVALKVLEHGDGLAREARIGGLLRHPNLVDVYEIGQDGGAWFCAMELCPDGSLADDVPLPPRAVVEVGLQVCAALQYAHEELGLVHLDLKPGNLLRAGPVVKVADLGIARATGFGDAAPSGTPGFMAPEQARGGPLDARTDVYALGATLQVLATGAMPSAPATFAFEDTVASLPDVPWLDHVLARCLDPEPAARFGSMAELAVALRALRVDGAGLAELFGAAPDRRDDAFVGRRAEIEALGVPKPGVTTLKGPPGVGKTRIAREVAGGAVWCDLTDARDLVQALAAELGVPLAGDGEAQVGRALAASGDVLVVLDGFEAARGGAALTRWMARAPDVRWLLTSREPAQVDGERILEIGPLPESDAVALIRARAAERGVDLPEGPELIELAHRLDGLPLAVELAAGRLGVLSVDDVLDRLSLSLLRGGRADRHGTLRAALLWSWDTLAPAEQRSLAALSVFAGPFDATAAAAVAPEVSLEALQQRSLVSRRDDRWTLLAPVRAFAAEHLVDRVAAEARHGHWFARFGSEEALAAVERGEVAEGIAAVDDLIAACRRAVARADASIAVATFHGAAAALERLGPPARIVELAEAVLSLPHLGDEALASVGGVAGRACFFSRGVTAAEGFLRPALEAARRSGEPRLLARVLLPTADADRRSGRLDAASERVRELLLLGDADPWILPFARHLQGSVALDRGGLADARPAFEHALALAGDDRPGLAVVVHVSLAVLARQEGRHEGGIPGLQQALRIARDLDDRLSEARLHLELGNASERSDADRDRARAHFVAAETQARRIGERRIEAQAGGCLASLAKKRGELAEACSRYEAAVAVSTALGDVRLEAMLRGNYSIALLDLGRPEEALAQVDSALARIPRADRVSRAYLLAQRGGILIDAARLGEADADLAEALEVAEERGLPLREWLRDRLADVKSRRERAQAP